LTLQFSISDVNRVWGERWCASKILFSDLEIMVASDGIEPPTPAFSAYAAF
jgi:hypothetical protein